MHVERERLFSRMMTVLLTLQGNNVFTYHEVDKTTSGSPLQKVIPWNFTYNVTYSFPSNKRQEKGEKEKWKNQSRELQRRTAEVGIFLTGSLKKWHLCYWRNSKLLLLCSLLLPLQNPKAGHPHFLCKTMHCYRLTEFEHLWQNLMGFAGIL